MAHVRLSRYEAEEGDLPPLCVCCGRSATHLEEKTLSWRPGWVVALILTGPLWFLAALAFTQRMQTRLPLCDTHRVHWMWRSWFIYGGLPVLFILAIGSVALLGDVDRQYRSVAGTWAGLACFGSCVLGVAWLFTAVLIQQLAIHASEITNRSITLTNLSPRFVEAVEREHRMARAEAAWGQGRRTAADRRPR
jgi:hypothetical protein